MSNLDKAEALLKQAKHIGTLAELIAEKLTTNVPVTLTCNGKRLMTYYPDGTVVNHVD